VDRDITRIYIGSLDGCISIFEMDMETEENQEQRSINVYCNNFRKNSCEYVKVVENQDEYDVYLDSEINL